jgi:hypothetical protein
MIICKAVLFQAILLRLIYSTVVFDEVVFTISMIPEHILRSSGSTAAVRDGGLRIFLQSMSYPIGHAAVYIHFARSVVCSEILNDTALKDEWIFSQVYGQIYPHESSVFSCVKLVYARNLTVAVAARTSPNVLGPLIHTD